MKTETFGISKKWKIKFCYHGFGQAQFAYGGSILVLIQFSLISQLLKKMTLDS